MIQSHSFTKFPNRVLKLFKPRPPLQYIKPSDYPEEKHKTHSISPISNLLSTNALIHYLQEFPNGTENKHLDKYDEIRNMKKKNEKELQKELEKWIPEEDQNIKDTDPFKTIFIGRLPYSIDELELQKQFIKFGEVERVRIVKDKLTKTPKGYAFILFKDVNASRKVHKELGIHRGIMINGRPVIVDIERSRTVKYFKPRRLGGGLGGRGYMRRERQRQLQFLSSENHGKRITDEDRRFKQHVGPNGNGTQIHNSNHYGYSHHSSSNYLQYSMHRHDRQKSRYISATSGSPSIQPSSSQVSQAITAYKSRHNRTNPETGKSKETTFMEY